MNRKGGRGIEYLVFAATVTISCFAGASHLLSPIPKTARLATFSRDWTTVVQEIVKAGNIERALEIGKSAGLKIFPERGKDFTKDTQVIDIVDPATFQSVLLMSIWQDSFPIPTTDSKPRNPSTNHKASPAVHLDAVTGLRGPKRRPAPGISTSVLSTPSYLVYPCSVKVL
jgi:hypothetical protein